MREWIFRFFSFLLSVLVIWTSSGLAVAQKQLKYLPKSLIKPPKIPAVINPALSPKLQARLATLDLAFEVNFARAQAQWLTTHSTLTTCNTPTLSQAPFPEQFIAFIAWMDKLPDKKIVDKDDTLQALNRLRHAILNYSSLPKTHQAKVNWLVITLNQFRKGKLGKFPNGDFFKIVYHPAKEEGALPAAERFHLLQEQKGLFRKQISHIKILYEPLKTLKFAYDYENPDKIVGLTFRQGFPLLQTRQELEHTLYRLIPPGYNIRISAHELGLFNHKQKFRQGFLHVHIEKIDVSQTPIPTDVSMELWLSMVPFAGIINPQTRKILVPFGDKQIAKNYLFLLDKYLSAEARACLERIAR